MDELGLVPKILQEPEDPSHSLWPYYHLMQNIILSTEYLFRVSDHQLNARVSLLVYIGKVGRDPRKPTQMGKRKPIKWEGQPKQAGIKTHSKG